MKCLSFSNGSLIEGLVLSVDERLGQVVFLGQSGPKGARYEKVRLDRENPAAVTGGKVFEAEAKKITLPAREGKPEKVFFTLAKSSAQKTDAVLVRICTQGIYTRGTYGSWRAVEGKPEGLISGVGADTESTKNDSWSDGLVIVHPGDVIKITLSGGAKFDPYALYFDAAGKLTVADFGQWQAGKAASEVQRNTTQVEVVYGTMPVYSFGRTDDGWGVSRGIETQSLPGGRGFQLGPRKGGWRAEKKVTIAVADDLPMDVEEAAVAKTGENFVLVNSTKAESGKYLVRIDTVGLRKGGRTGAVAVIGNPTLLTEGWMEIGTQNVQHHRDQLWVLSYGDFLRVGQISEEHYSSDDAVYVENGEVVTEKFRDWALREARKNPALFISEGWCPLDRLPPEWVGKVVEIEEAGRDGGHGTYVITAIRPKLILTGGWDEMEEGKKFTIAVPSDWVWAHLRADLVAEAKTTILEVKEVVEFGDPPFPAGTQVVATIKQTMVHHELVPGGTWGAPTPAHDEKVTQVTIADAPGRKIRITKYEKSGLENEGREELGPVKAEYIMPSYEAGKLHVSEGMPELLNGQYLIEIVEPRRGGWYAHVVREAVVSSEATMDLKVYLGKNDSRDPAHVWVIAADGNVIGENKGAGEANFIGIPVSVVVLRYQRSNYGYTDTEEWEVYYLPASGMTAAQLAKAQEIDSALEHRYFQGEGTGWDFSKVGVVRYQTPYTRDIREGTGQYDELQKFYAAYPVDVAKYKRVNQKVAKDAYTDPKHPIIRSIMVGPELL